MSVKELVKEVGRLPPKEKEEVLDFIRFLRLKRAIPPSQMYFWTHKWQTMERAAEQDKARGRILGDGSVHGLLKALKS